MAEELLTAFGLELDSITIVPGIDGVFDVSVNGTRVFSLDQEGRFPTVDDIKPGVKAVM